MLQGSVFHEEAWIAPDASVVGDVRLGKEASIWFQAVVRADYAPIFVGARSNVQDHCVLHVDDGFPLHLGLGVTVGHACVLHGCAIGDGSLIGMGSIILNGATIGENCLIGAGSLIPEGKHVPDGSLAFGSPMKIIRTLTTKEIASLKESENHYVDLARRYRAHKFPRHCSS